MAMRETMARRKQWTPERIAEVRSLWDAGLTLRVIGERLSLSRGTVSGVVDRHGFPGRPEPERIREWKARDRRRKQREIPTGWQETGRGITLMELRPAHCRWPVGEAHGALQRFCGVEAAGGSVYCAGHGARAFVASRGVTARPRFELPKLSTGTS
jgi:hypothetical protein